MRCFQRAGSWMRLKQSLTFTKFCILPTLVPKPKTVLVATSDQKAVISMAKLRDAIWTYSNSWHYSRGFFNQSFEKLWSRLRERPGSIHAKNILECRKLCGDFHRLSRKNQIKSGGIFHFRLIKISIVKGAYDSKSRYRRCDWRESCDRIARLKQSDIYWRCSVL